MTQLHERGRAAIHARCACAPANNPIQAQVERCRATALKNGLAVVASYEDPNHSGLKATRRPGLATLLRAAKLGAFQYLVVTGVARLSRSTSDLIGLLAELADLNILILTADGCDQPIQMNPAGFLKALRSD